MSQTVHIWSLRDKGASAAIYDGNVRDVAAEVLHGIESHGHGVKYLSTTYGLDGWVSEVTYEVSVVMDGKPYVWLHVFTEPRDEWLRLEESR